MEQGLALAAEPSLFDPAVTVQGTYAVVACPLYWVSSLAALRTNRRGFVCPF